MAFEPLAIFDDVRTPSAPSSRSNAKSWSGPWLTHRAQKNLRSDIMPKLTMVKALNLALHQAMERDDDVLVLGQDVGVDGGVFRVTEGLLESSASSA